MCNCTSPIEGSAQILQEKEETCTYTQVQMESWKDLLLCVKSKSIIHSLQTSSTEVNAALGVVIAAIGYGENLCYYAEYLDKTKPLILKIIQSGLCQSEK